MVNQAKFLPGIYRTRISTASLLVKTMPHEIRYPRVCSGREFSNELRGGTWQLYESPIFGDISSVKLI